nr:hypothetical protein [Tanacetum cinerariifolium]
MRISAIVLHHREFQQPEFEAYRPKTSKSASEDILNELKKHHDVPLVKNKVSKNRDCSVESPVVVEKKGYPQQVQEDQGYVDSKCSRHITWTMSYPLDFKEFDRGYVTFRGGAKRGRITSKGTLKTGK